jgi:hypothetical protein
MVAVAVLAEGVGMMGKNQLEVAAQGFIRVRHS